MGPGPVAAQVEHALAMGEAAVRAGAGPPAGLALDLGTGAGLPGLVLALLWPASWWVLLDSRRRSTTFVMEAVDQLGLGARVRVVLSRAEELGRLPDHRGRYTLVTARGVGPPPMTAECAAPLLELGGSLLVSEPPGGSDRRRWPADGLSRLGLQAVARVTARGAGAVVFRQEVLCGPEYPRRSGLPAKRPLWSHSEVDVSRETEGDT